MPSSIATRTTSCRWRFRTPGTLSVVLALVLFLPGLLQGGQSAPSVATSATDMVGLPFAFDGPAPPVAPQVINRDGPARATIRAARLDTSLQLDGRLDDEIYQQLAALSDFIQQEPRAGMPATEQTEVWVFFDQSNVYVSARCWDSQPDRMIANEMRRDGARVPRNEDFAFSFDTFYDRRSGYNFEVTPVGGRLDTEIINDGTASNRDWNPVWEVVTSRFDRGWMVEARIPFKSLRYRPGTAQIWGFQVRRLVRWKNEISYITGIPASVGERGHHRVSLSPTLVGIEAPPGGKNLEIKPYTISSLASDATSTPRVSNDLKGDWGADVKYGITKGLTADFTYNTDFAQVEADLQQVNLSRFSLFFPEKREFFLENAGVFTFGGATGTDNTPALFYSRRIGLAGTDSSPSVVPIVAGGRVTGRTGRFSVGVLNIESDDLPSSRARATNFSVVRVKRDILRRSSIGAIFTGRSVGRSGVGTNEAYGIDAAFGLTNTITANAFWAQTRSEGLTGDDTSYRAQFEYAGDRYGFLTERLNVGAHFNPEIGFVRHPDLARSFAQFRFSPRPRASNKVVRKFYYTANMEYIENGAGRVDTRTATGEFAVDFQKGDRASVKYSNTYEFLPARLTLAPGVIVPVGAYEYSSVLFGYNFGPQRKAAVANLTLEQGSFYGGDKTAVTVTNGLVSFPPHVMIEPTYSLNRVNLTQGSFTTHLLGPRVTYTVTPPMFVSALMQFNSTTHAATVNLRFRWEYQPGSELFVVWNETRDTSGSGFPALSNRALIVKINHLFRL